MLHCSHSFKFGGFHQLEKNFFKRSNVFLFSLPQKNKSMILDELIFWVKFLNDFISPFSDHFLIGTGHMKSRNESCTNNSLIRIIDETFDVSLYLNDIGWIDNQWNDSESVSSKVKVLMMNIFH